MNKLIKSFSSKTEKQTIVVFL